MATAPAKTVVSISHPNMQKAQFQLIGDAPLVIHRFSAKTKQQFKDKMETGKAASSKKTRVAQSTDDLFEEARYKAKAGWDGIHASAIRNACISACRLVGFKMTLAKMSIFIQADGWDYLEPQIPLVKIMGKAIKQEDIARVETGQPYLCVRAAFHEWKMNPTIRWDADQFTISDVTNLLSRVGMQVGLGEGRPDSKNSAGMGWGLFHIEGHEEVKA